MQHNSWKKDKELLSEAYGQIGAESEEGDGNVLERLEAFMNSHPETVEGLRQIIIDFEDIVDDINRLEAEDGTVDAADLGIHLARLAPDTTRGSAL